MSNPNRPPEADLPQPVPITSIFETFAFNTGTDRLLIDNGLPYKNLRPFVISSVPNAFFRDYIVDPTLYTKQRFDSNSVYFLLSGQLEVRYTDTGEIQRFNGGFYDSTDWISYNTFWDKDRDCSITPSPSFHFIQIKKRTNSTLSPEYNNFDNLNITVKKLENSEVTIEAANNSCIFVVNNENDFVIESGGEVFDRAARPTTSNLTFQNGGLDNYFYEQERIFKFLVSGTTKIFTANLVHVILFSPK
jgi:hypothetical protein